jgi:class 3 adenylate cyclase
MTATRRLAAILAADVAGYSRLMGADEEGTHERLRAHRRELVDPTIEEHRGRIVKSTGDGMLVEFPSVVDAVRCAVALQQAMIDREAGMAEDRRIRFRIGINLGDVIVDDGDIFGDGVNVAARLEALAEPGGICIPGTVRDHIGDRLPYVFEDALPRSRLVPAGVLRRGVRCADQRTGTSRTSKRLTPRTSITRLIMKFGSAVARTWCRTRKVGMRDGQCIKTEFCGPLHKSRR